MAGREGSEEVEAGELGEGKRQKAEVKSKKEAGGKMQEARCRRQETGGRKQEAGNRRQEAMLESLCLCAFVVKNLLVEDKKVR